MSAVMPLAELREDRRSSTSLWTSGTAIVLYVACVRLVLYAIAGPNYGYFRDELYYLACGQRPAWGYVDQPPLIAWVAWLLEHTIGTSLYALRLLPALAHTASIVLSGLLARELGGRRWAMFLAALATLLCPVALAFGHLFTMNAFDLVFWTAIAFCVVRIDHTGNQRLWLAVGVLTGITLLNKYGIAFWIVSLLIAMACTPLRNSFRQRWLWIACLLAALISFPNFWWQYSHHFPFLELMHNVRASGRDIWLPPLPYLKAQAEMLGYASFILVIFALIFAFTRAGRNTRVLGIAYLIFLTMLMALHGKMYYLAPVYPMVFACGGVACEAWTSRRALVWAKPLLALAIAAISGIYAPTILPLLSVDHFLAYEHAMGIEQQKFEHTAQGKLPQIYADMFGWQEMTETVARYYNSLSPEEKKNTAIVANNYGEGGAIDFFGPRYGLPHAIGVHQNYWIWGPGQYAGRTVNLIVLGEGDPQRMDELCTTHSVIGSEENPLSRPEEWGPIYACNGFKYDLGKIWPEVKRWN